MKVSHYSDDYDKLRAWMIARREESGLSLRDVGTQMGRHHSVIGKLEQNRRHINIIEFVEYCLIIKADPTDGIRLLEKVVKKTRKNKK